MIGFYDYTVVLTYISLAVSVFGMTQAIEGRFRTAIACLAISGLCDMFDGKIARTKKDRTYDEKLFGVQIDSLCDVICFGAFPVILCYVLGVKGVIGEVAIAYYSVCSVIRLGFFNVLETSRQVQEDNANKFYYGLPITSITIILPLIFLFNFILAENIFKWILVGTLFCVGTLFITNFRLKKPSNKQLCFWVILVACSVAMILFFSKYPITHTIEHEEPLIEKILD
ncbi:MAG: CDP-alcohol phosphatidyltransferase family protein [Candidatus Galacturonibacter soehngenii]|uniref:CDP-diacylglycerol--serine O-phosphatidyltransferase n=2 Tax=Candidatus Galacturonatibacter soehngenii TaxID=2307010 RepID=A0A7V7QNT8_9FIRM|nr:CDP-alcohol phosphatidyltransferase family protein [Candidatus Galacturonibacter soehngenii]KAB1440752.1 CDP-diacylglycerol--serine O-phosphatidyltransferase [Candidatus Galacturonibacter soehngenii]MBA4687878.1 CDP-alcohol phosphatidyltransferase family protein [Candidatus Galacturonibacter soehngenii]